MVLSIVGASILCLVLIGGAVYLALQEGKGEDGKPITAIGDTVEIQGRNHIAVGAEHDPYNSNPPTSGPHYEQPAPWNIYTQEIPDETLIHNLEHGGVWISYKPGKVDKTTIDRLGQISKPYTKTIMTPRNANDSAIALVSWGKILKLESLDEKKVKAFIELNRFKAPEPNAP